MKDIRKTDYYLPYYTFVPRKRNEFEKPGAIIDEKATIVAGWETNRAPLAAGDR